MFHWRSWFLFDLCAHDISTDFSMHKKNKTESIITKHESTLHVCEILAQRWYRRVSLSSAVSVGRHSLLQTLELGDWTDASPTLRQSPQQDKTFMPRIRSKGKGYTCRVGVSRNFCACAYVRCAPDARYIYSSSQNNVYVHRFVERNA